MYKCYLDTETTGLSPDYASLLEVAAIIIDEEGSIVDTFHEYINPGRKIPEEIVNITHITDDKVADCRREGPVLADFVTWLKGYGVITIVAYNAPFDMKFLRGRSDLWKVDHPFYSVDVVDPMKTVGDLLKSGKLVTEKTPTGRKSKKQESVAKALGISYGDGGAHSAIEDVTVLYKIHKKLQEMV